MLLRKFSFAALALLAALTGPAAQAQEKPAVIHIGSTAPGHLKFVLAQQQAWFDKEFAKDGIKIDLVPFTGGGSEATTALATGSLDVAYTGSNPALRVAAFLLDVAAGYEAMGFSGKHFILRMSRADMASYLALKHETVSRALSHLVETNCISVQRREMRKVCQQVHFRNNRARAPDAA